MSPRQLACCGVVQGRVDDHLSSRKVLNGAREFAKTTTVGCFLQRIAKWAANAR